MYATLLKNRIYKNGAEYCCFFCNVKLVSIESAVEHTANDVDHVQQVTTAAFFRNVKIDEDLCIKLVDNGIVFISNREYRCIICLCSISNIDHVSEHINGKKHATKHRRTFNGTIDNANSNEPNDDQDNEVVADSPNDEQVLKSEECSNHDHNEELYYNQFDQDNSNEANLQIYSCIKTVEKEEDSCPMQFSKKEVQFQDRSLHNHVPVIKSDLIYCNSCHNYLEPNSALRYHRMFHLSQKSGNAYDIISFSTRKNIRESIYCMMCDCMMKDEYDLENHLMESRHQKRSIMFYYLTENTFANMVYRNCLNTTVPQNVNNIYNILEFNKYLQYVNYQVYQSASSAVVQSSPMNYKFNQQSIMNSNVPITHNQSMQVPLNYSAFPLFFCFVCHVEFVDETLLYYHYTYDVHHKFRMEAINILKKDKNIQFATFSNDEFIVCTKCQIQMIDANGAVNHIFELQHAMENQIEHENIVINNGIILANTNVYTCPICKINLTDDSLMIQHLESECHKKSIQEYYVNINSATFEKIIFSCSQCNMNFFNDNTLLEHLYISHEKNYDVASKDKIYHSNNKCVGNTETHQYQSINSVLLNNNDHTLNNSVYSNLNKGNSLENVKTSISKRNDDFEVNEIEKSSSKIHTKNLINFSQRYVKLCVEYGEENIFRINPERVKMLELGIHLTFPYKAGRGCIPCGVEVSSDPQLLYEHLRTESHEKNLLEMEENDEFFENYDDQFSDLELAKQYMYEDSDEWIKCFACNTQIENCDDSIHNHVNSESHINNCQPWINSANEIFQIFNNMFKNLWYYIDKFFCNICCTHFVFEVDYVRHLESSQHLKEVESRILRKQNLQFDYCIICSYFWYARSDQYKIHCNKDSHKYILKSRDFTVPNMPDTAKTMLTTVEETVDDLILESNEIASSDGDVETQLLESVEEVVKSKYPTAKAYLFGSRISNLGIKDSDLDIYLDCKNQYKKLSSIDECQEQLLIVQECFHKYQDIWIIEEIVLRTRVPIIKIRHRPTNLNCDISFINGLSVEKSKILSYFIDACLPCRKMILYLKVWNNLCGLSGKRGITTFAISWLVIFYFQLQGFLPSVWDLIKLKNQSNVIAGWETGISKIIPVKEIDLSTKDLLKGFFSYYANFDYISNVASPYLGQVMLKSQFSHVDDLPDEMDIYKVKIKEGQVDFFRLDSPMCIQEPIDLSQNLTKAVTKLHLRMFKQYCSESAAILQNSTSECPAIDIEKF